VNRSVLPETTPADYAFRYVDIGAVTDGRVDIPDADVVFASAPSRARRLAPAGATVVSTVRTYLRAVARVPDVQHPLVFSTGFAVLEARPGMHPGFLHYACRSSRFIEEVVARSTGVGYPAITAGDLANIKVYVPPVEQQQRVAALLEDHLKALDEVLMAHETLLTLMDERIEARIGEYIVPALAGEAGHPMLPIKRLLRKVSRTTPVGAPVVTAFRDGQVIARSLRRAEGYTESWTDSAVMQGVEVGDVVVHGLDGFAGAVGTSESAGACSPANHVCVPLDGGDTDFYGRMLRIFARSGYLSLYGGSARERAVDFRNWATFSRIPLPIVSAEAQQEIGESIRVARDLRVQTRRLLELVVEKKQALVDAAIVDEAAGQREGGAA